MIHTYVCTTTYKLMCTDHTYQPGWHSKTTAEYTWGSFSHLRQWCVYVCVRVFGFLLIACLYSSGGFAIFYTPHTAVKSCKHKSSSSLPHKNRNKQKTPFRWDIDDRLLWPHQYRVILSSTTVVYCCTEVV